MYSGNCGPGTFVATVCTISWEWTTRTGEHGGDEPGGATVTDSRGSRPKRRSRVTASGRPSGRGWLARSSIGSSIPTGSRAYTAETRLSSTPRASGARIDTGMSVVTVRFSTGSPTSEQQLAQTTRNRGEHDVVDGATEHVAQRLDVIERHASARPTAVRSDRSGQRCAHAVRRRDQSLEAGRDVAETTQGREPDAAPRRRPL